jgi:hypothetical protein
VIVALQQFVAQHKAQAFEADMARMAADPQIQADCAAISREFLPTEYESSGTRSETGPASLVKNSFSFNLSSPLPSSPYRTRQGARRLV